MSNWVRHCLVIHALLAISARRNRACQPLFRTDLQSHDICYKSPTLSARPQLFHDMPETTHISHMDDRSNKHDFIINDVGFYDESTSRKRHRVVGNPHVPEGAEQRSFHQVKILCEDSLIVGVIVNTGTNMSDPLSAW